MKTLEEIKDEYAGEQGRDSWEEFFKYCDLIHTRLETMQYHHDQVAKRFTIEVAKQTLENIASKSQEMIYSRKMITRDILNEPIVLNQHCYAVPKHEILKETNIPDL
ncbi:hypothetical protein D3C87_447660 [compost metagenome]